MRLPFEAERTRAARGNQQEVLEVHPTATLSVCCPIGKDIYKFNLAAWTLFKNGDRQFASVSLLAVVD